MKMLKKLINAVCLVLLASTVLPVYSSEIYIPHMTSEIIDVIDVENASYTLEDVKWALTVVCGVLVGVCICNELYNDFVRHIVKKTIKELDARKIFIEKTMAVREAYLYNVEMLKNSGWWNSLTEKMLLQEYSSKMFALVWA